MSQQTNLDCLLIDRVTAMLVDSLSFRYISMEKGVSGKIRVDPEPIADDGDRIAFSPHCPNGAALRDMVERKIKEMRASGELGSIFAHYGAEP